ncbi:mitochondrial ribonuclease P catalytic subunit isoform X1 [Prionailurus iriomotensis]
MVAFSVSAEDYCGIRNQQKWFSLKAVSPQNTKAVNLLIAKARYLRKGDEGSNQVSSDSHLFAAGAAKKRSQMNTHREDHALPPARNTIQLPTRPLNSEEWDKFKEDFKGKANFENWIISQMAHCHSSIDVAKSLLAWVAAKNNGIVGYNLLVKYLYLCVFHKHIAEVIDVYEIMKARYKRLEPGGYTLLIRGLIHSDRWKEALLLLEDIKKVMIPSKKNYNDCIEGALLHQDVNLAWNFIKTWFESVPGEQWKGQFTTIQGSGQCSGCGKTIESLHLSPEEYEFLKEKIMRDVIDGGDQYKKTTPQELERFQNFVKCCPPFDIVIDGLNVAKTFPKARESQVMLLHVVSQLAKQNLQLLVLGRKHMLTQHSRWRKDEMKKVQKQASCFFADNISADDPFLLYATLHSGNHCKFITKDLMRDHKACLHDAKTQRLFFKWQQGHQLAIINTLPGSKITFQHIPSYDTVVQTTGDSWHIPYDEDLLERYSYEVPTKWLCLHRKT